MVSGTATGQVWRWCALAGAAAWVSDLWADLSTLRWLGAGLLTIAVALVAVRMVRPVSLWAGSVTVVGTTVLAGSLTALARASGDLLLVDAALGGVAAFAVTLSVLRPEPRESSAAAGGWRGESSLPREVVTTPR